MSTGKHRYEKADMRGLTQRDKPEAHRLLPQALCHVLKQRTARGLTDRAVKPAITGEEMLEFMRPREDALFLA